MNSLEHELQYPLGDYLPEGGIKKEVAPNIYWVRMPLPFALNHINLWLVRESDSWTLIDCGIASEEIKALWLQIFSKHLDGLPIGRIICTHMHPDHVGLASWVQAQYPKAVLWMTLGEYALSRVLSATIAGTDGAAAARHFETHGLSNAETLTAIKNRNDKYYASLVPNVPLSFHRIRADENITLGGREWSVIIGTGHSPEHASLYCHEEGLLISGDMVLPRISTNVSVFELEPESNPVTWYVKSLTAYAHCKADTLVLPSHGRPFKNVHRRIEQLTEHHADRLRVVLAACALKAQSAYDIVPIMFERNFDTHQMTFALGEALGHLHALLYDGLVTRVKEDGVIRFSAT